MFENEIRKYDEVAEAYKQTIIVPMGMEQFRERNEVLFSCHSCGIEAIPLPLTTLVNYSNKVLATILLVKHCWSARRWVTTLQPTSGCTVTLTIRLM